MNKKTIFAILCCLVLGAGVLHASSGDGDTSRSESPAALQLDHAQPAIQPAVPSADQIDDGSCLSADQADVALADDGAADQAAGYECPPYSSYCRRDRDCDQDNGEVCQNGCCYAAF